MKAQKENELWAYEESERLITLILNMPECKTTKGWTKQVCQNKKSGSGLCKPRWYSVHIRHWQFVNALEKIGIPIVGMCKNLVMVYAMSKDEAEDRVDALAKAMHHRVWEGTDCNDDFAFKLALKPEFI